MTSPCNTRQRKRNIVGNVGINNFYTARARDRILPTVWKIKNIRESFLCEDCCSHPRVDYKLEWKDIVQHERYNHEVVLNLNGNLHPFSAICNCKTQSLCGKVLKKRNYKKTG